MTHRRQRCSDGTSDRKGQPQLRVFMGLMQQKINALGHWHRLSDNIND